MSDNQFFQTGDDRNLRLSVWPVQDFEQLLTLPDGTEVALFGMTLVPQLGFQGVTLRICDESRRVTQEYIDTGENFPYQLAVSLLPDDVVPDTVPDLTNQTGD